MDFIAFSNFLSVGTCKKTGPVSIIEEAGENILLYICFSGFSNVAGLHAPYALILYFFRLSIL